MNEYKKKTKTKNNKITTNRQNKNVYQKNIQRVDCKNKQQITKFNSAELFKKVFFPGLKSAILLRLNKAELYLT